MNKIRYAVIILFTLMPFVTIPMDRKLALAKSRQESRVKSAQGEYVTPRSNERKQQSSALAQAPVYGTTEQTTKNAGRQLSQAPHVTIRKKVANIDESAQTLYDQAIFLHPQKQNSRLNHDTSIAQKIGFDQSIKRGNVRQTVAFLNAENGLKTSYPLAIKLYAVMTDRVDGLEIHPSETAIIPAHKICLMAKSLATFGNNEKFLENYARIMHENPEMRKIINGDQ